MRRLSNEEIITVESETGYQLAKIEVDGLNECGVVNYQILVKKCNFKPDANHKNETASDGHSICYMIALYTTTGTVVETRFFTQCTEAEVFIHVGNYMGTVRMFNTLADRYYLSGFNGLIDD
jgi:hypothetical protein